ncbi:unnamed protein product [Rhizoctonia solani]|uniref:C2H2-type domain-containing protein n=1 Tax=Rhizoctonia solani TaxID=456999 RepID=A0A8H3HT55_9AGAM|nr:unnamed protein product [Rhizoctonia solani]
MGYRGDSANDFERVEALTISQLVVVLWAHVGTMAIRVVGLFVSLWISLQTLVLSHHSYIETELEEIVSTLEEAGSIKSKDLTGFLEKLRTLGKTRNLIWKELPWAHVRCEVQESLPSSPLLGLEASLIEVILEGKESSHIPVSAFQRHILRRVELQANLVQQVGLGRGDKISAEIQGRLSLIWGTIRDDDSDANYIDSLSQDPTHYWIYDESASPILHIPNFLSTQASIEKYVADALQVLDQGVRKIRCSLCKDKGTSKLWDVKLPNLMRHVSTHFETKGYYCPDCGRGFTTRDQRRKHMTKRHGRNVSEISMLDSLVGQLINS